MQQRLYLPSLRTYKSHRLVKLLFDELRKNRSTSEDDARKFEFHAYYPPFPLPGLSRQICELEVDVEGRESRGPDMENIRIIEMAVDSR